MARDAKGNEWRRCPNTACPEHVRPEKICKICGTPTKPLRYMFRPGESADPQLLWNVTSTRHGYVVQERVHEGEIAPVIALINRDPGIPEILTCDFCQKSVCPHIEAVHLWEELKELAS